MVVTAGDAGATGAGVVAGVVAAGRGADEPPVAAAAMPAAARTTAAAMPISRLRFDGVTAGGCAAVAYAEAPDSGGIARVSCAGSAAGFIGYTVADGDVTADESARRAAT